MRVPGGHGVAAGRVVGRVVNSRGAQVALAVVDFDAKLPERAGDVSGPVLEPLDGAEKLDGRGVEFEGEVLGLGRYGAVGVLRADAETLVGAEDGPLEFEEESGVDHGISHGDTVAADRIDVDARFGGVL